MMKTFTHTSILLQQAQKDKDNKTYKRIVELYQEEDIEKAIEEDTKGGSFLVKLTQEELDAAFEDLTKIT